MIGKLIGSGQLGRLASFVSPAFFDVMPAKALWRKAKELYAQSRDSEAFRHAVAARAAELRGSMPQIWLATSGEDGGHRPAGQDPAKAHDAPWRGAQVVELYFRQLFEPGPCLLDLRAASFQSDADRLIWRPAPWLNAWEPGFIAPLRDLYRGFYEHDDGRFEQGLRALSLEHSADLFRAHFGHGQMQFRTRDFIQTFHQVFLRCKKARTSLHPDFLPLGIYLAALYDHLEELAVSVDIDGAFARATATAHPTEEAAHA